MSDAGQVVLTPSVARFARLALFWVVIAVIILIIAVIGIAISSGAQNTDPMSATNASPNGGKALVEVLRHEGVRVTVTDTLGDTESAIDSPKQTTLFVYDANYYLSAEQVHRALHLASTVVLLDPTFEVLDEISPDLASAGYVDGTLEANCRVDAASTAEDITGDGNGFRVLDDALDAETCFGSGDDVYSLVQLTSIGTEYTVLGATEALTNGVILDNGNAALGLNLLGANENLVWYVPGPVDLDSDIPTTGQLSPPWVLPVTLVLFLVVLAAAVWRGRRLGPLIVENLPVTVRASETMQGRARLYEKANARAHTLDSLRIGTIARLAKLTGLPVLSTVDEVIATAAAHAGMDPRQVRRLLIDAQPRSDREMVGLSDELLTLERLVAHNSRPH